MTQEQRNEFIALAEPLMKWLAENFDSHTTALVTNTAAEILTGEAGHSTTKFLEGIEQQAFKKEAIAIEKAFAASGHSIQVIERL